MYLLSNSIFFKYRSYIPKKGNELLPEILNYSPVKAIPAWMVFIPGPVFLLNKLESP